MHLGCCSGMLVSDVFYLILPIRVKPKITRSREAVVYAPPFPHVPIPVPKSAICVVVGPMLGPID